MLVSGLKNQLLGNMASGSDVKFAAVHKSLCECAQAMLERYKQKQPKTEKCKIKTRATEILLTKLNTVPEDSAATSETIASALECHVKALQGHEHLLSKKGNTYALMQQTKALRKRDADADDSLLQYHDLKDKLLASDSPLSAELKAFAFRLAGSQDLNLQVLKTMNEHSCTEKLKVLPYYDWSCHKNELPFKQRVQSFRYPLSMGAENIVLPVPIV